MITVRSPLRISLGGGGTDLPSYYKRHGGFVVSAAIDKYVYVTVLRPFQPGIFLKYSQLEHAHDVADVRHPIVREALVMTMDAATTPQIEITTLADIPAGTGLGSSGSFTTALLAALAAFHNQSVTAAELAERACELEIARLQEPVGKQDQYIAAHGGVSSFEFHPDDTVAVRRLSLGDEVLCRLQTNLLLFFTGYSRRASEILDDQHRRTLASDDAMVANLDRIKAIGRQSLTALEAGELDRFGRLLHEHWVHKRARTPAISNPAIDEYYNLAVANGAIGGKLVGAGGGGFLMFYADRPEQLRVAMRAAGLNEVRFRFDFEGTKVLSA